MNLPAEKAKYRHKSQGQLSDTSLDWHNGLNILEVPGVKTWLCWDRARSGQDLGSRPQLRGLGQSVETIAHANQFPTLSADRDVNYIG